MSLALVKSEILRFLASVRPEVLCIRGEWGIGKTYAWNTYLAEAKANRAIKLPTYAYVSLFGLNSLDQLRYSIFENTVGSHSIGVEPNLTTLTENTAAVLNNVGRKSLKVLQHVPYFGAKDVAGGVLGMTSLTVTDRIICLDDLDRKGANLRTADVMGLMSQLKEQKRCKVVLILNEEKLGAELEEFQKHFEKVVDTSIHFQPTPIESVLILVVQCASIKPSECGCLSIGFVTWTWKRQMNPAGLEHSGGKTEELFHKMDFACHAGLSVMIDNSGQSLIVLRALPRKR